MVTLADWFYERATPEWWGVKMIHIRGSRGCWFQEHMLGLFSLYQNFEVDTLRSTEDEKEVFIELKGRRF